MVNSLSAFEWNGWTCLKLKGRVDAFNDRQILMVVDQYVASGAIRIAMDLSATEFLSLQSLKAFAALVKDLQKMGGDLVIINPNHNVRRQIEIFLGLRVFSILASHEDLVSLPMPEYRPGYSQAHL